MAKTHRLEMAARLRAVLPALWAGVLLCIAAIVAPAAFGALSSAEAGRVVSRLFVREAWLSLVLASAMLWLERRHGAAGRTNSLLLYGTVLCTLAGYFGVQPLMTAARAGQGALSFGQLHLISTLFYAAKTALVLWLAWRAAGAEFRPPSS